jgi:glycolate oxidase iron-sulfur subunit
MDAPLPDIDGSPQAAAPRVEAAAGGLSCVHCGRCLPGCPTYTQTLQQADSARGRAPTLQSRLLRWVLFHVFTQPKRLRWALLPARVLQRVGVYGLMRRVGLFKVLPAGFRQMEQMLPSRGPLWPAPLPEILRAKVVYDETSEPGRPRAEAPRKRIGFFAGCVGSVMFDGVNRQALELLSAAGCDVLTAGGQVCCGAIHHHNGAPQTAEDLARLNIDAFLPEGREQVELVVTNIAGCGAMLREYDHLLRDDPAYAERAKAFAGRVRDISEALVEVGLPPMKHRVEETITYHDACHQPHAQQVTSAARRLLASVPGLTLQPLPESEMCCGAAGTCNLVQSKMHPVEILHRAVFGG